MPKEYVIDHYNFNEEHSRGLRVQVGWNREASHVTIATVADKPPESTGFSSDEGWHVSLDRSGINDLIRYLRRARDQAFGRDE